ncbi:hypothetical protein A3C91_00525 [Candidatus Azambacteria bacterium RIFCSPHIGHO2_02_FULL_52_12]|uniref:Uncharacterized protein n=1 Tax=Candidatus Azambacteria bacterium RIFCSPLOWO2_01_FULL_46_25 TaxID=1797298 RepID=A0A1F5BTM4_9BACT|nr:MAG: hypothetical protein A3C91_00525 [Candidatus Azambacteria bacterium RIFCSPHIGHO2_02_FULL_52_12]OGD33962.1 MAG: hypothetical protein A2988_00525 [Candidatus Azambacteria bacterium RIFCSPLOWO2_01_FULL_46_25]OGD37648.1 MAG: hypothetical protein A2850_04600 [Candidatus Azambacteria bacterium RIFCSPHIGHO2_01_FULL_51_74]
MEPPQTQAKEAAPADKTPGAMQAQMKAVHEAFAAELGKAKKEHRESLNAILKGIDERKIKDLKEKLKNL